MAQAVGIELCSQVCVMVQAVGVLHPGPCHD